MPLTRSDIRRTAEKYLARHPEERAALAGLMTLLDGADDPADRATLPGHVTCSAAVIDREQRVLHIAHRGTGLLLPPGGHIEGDRTLLAAALREVCEETGLQARDLCLTPQFLGSPVDVDIHDIDANPSKGEGPHQHFDFRYAFYLSPEDHPELALQDAEVDGARWLELSKVRSSTLRSKLLAARAQGLGGKPEPVNASALIHNGEGAYLLHLRDDRPGIWQPWNMALLGGGRCASDRDLMDTVRRELAEEVPGLDVGELTPYAVEEETSVDGLAVPIQVFSGLWRGDVGRLRLHEGVLLYWASLSDLDRLRLTPGLAGLIRRHAAEESAAGEVVPHQMPGAPEGVRGGSGA
ncbi:NUDIX hydrolase [Streptomyces sp. MZ04]|uniref:NUDIX hydrolase n=1 Tax=Streptomyces sp. MZ04 TaxID=2559236 RepID=UPI00107EC07D|nr:NUDIX hydrolase [Streptomyces sp. MZ04]TGB08721.1 NUDIX hydrolase [Streptomyces sp. MZ04]